MDRPAAPTRYVPRPGDASAETVATESPPTPRLPPAWSRLERGTLRPNQEARPILNGSHVILYAKDADKTRAFFRDTLGLAHVSAGQGWLIFALPPAELGVHPDEVGGKHQFFLMCDDVGKTRAELTKKGVRFTQPVTDQGWGIMTAFDVPGLGELWMYEPRHPKPPQGGAPKKASKRAAGKKRVKTTSKPRAAVKAKKRAPARRRR